MPFSPRVLAPVLLSGLLAAQDSRADTRWQVALGLQQRSLHEEAAKGFARFAEEFPSDPRRAEAQYRAGTSWVALGRAAEAVAALQKAVATPGVFPLRPEARYRLGQLHREAKRWADAEACLGALLQEVPADHYLRAAAGFARGECLREAGRDAEALDAFLAAAAADREAEGAHAVPALYQAAFAALRLGQREAAAKHFLAAAERAPAHTAATECLYRAGEVRLALGDVAGADEAFARAAKGGGEYAARAGEARARARVAGLRALEEGGRPEDVVRSARDLLGRGDLGPGLRAEVGECLGRALLATGDAEGAHRAYVDAAEAAPDAVLRGEALYGACLALHRLGRHADARAAAETLLRTCPEHRLHAHAWFAIGESWFAERRTEPALAAFARVPADHALCRKAQARQAWCHYLAGEHGRAAEAFAALVPAQGEVDTVGEEALAMAAVAWLAAGQPDAALRAADRYRLAFPQGTHLARSERVAARALRAKGEAKAAAERLARAEAGERDPARRGEDRLERADLLVEQGRFRDAAAVYAGLRGESGGLGQRAGVGAAWCAFELGDDEVARREAEGLLAAGVEGDNEARLLDLLAILHLRNQRWAEAGSAAQRFLARHAAHPRAAELRYALGVAQARAGDAEGARRTLRPLVETAQGPQRDRVLHELAHVEAKAGDAKAAEAAFRTVADTGEDAELRDDAHLQLGLAALGRAELAAARPHLEAVRGALRGRALLALGGALVQQGDDAAAVAVLESALATLRGDERGEGLYFAGLARQRRGGHAEAAAHLGELLRTHPGHARAREARLVLGECELARGDAARAAAWLEEYLKDAPAGSPDTARGLLALGMARLARKEHAAAEAAFTKVARGRADARAAEAQYRIGEVRAARGDDAGAAEAWLELTILHDHGEWVPRALLGAGRCYERLGRKEQATKLFEELRRRHPDSPQAAELGPKRRGV
ncbi:MAG: tetratricopeptide repeat protein [Planctomycetes bacterium]|nr:tetratricopeptide repeat protein [Planctomycetota bacterium]